MANVAGFTNRDFRKKSADGRQKKGGDVFIALQAYKAKLPQLGIPSPQPSIHAKMRKKGLHGPVRGTKAFLKWNALHDGSITKFKRG